MIKELAQAITDLGQTGRLSEETKNHLLYVLSEEFKESKIELNDDVKDLLSESVRTHVESYVEDVREQFQSLYKRFDDADAVTDALQQMNTEVSSYLDRLKSQGAESLDAIKERSSAVEKQVAEVQERITRLESLPGRVTAVEKKQQQRQSTSAKK